MDNATCLPTAEPIARATSKATPPGRVGFGTELLRATAAEPPGPARPIAGAKRRRDHCRRRPPTMCRPAARRHRSATVGAEPSAGPAAAPEEFADPPAPSASTDEPSADATPRTSAEAAAGSPFPAARAGPARWRAAPGAGEPACRSGPALPRPASPPAAAGGSPLRRPAGRSPGHAGRAANAGQRPRRGRPRRSMPPPRVPNPAATLPVPMLPPTCRPGRAFPRRRSRPLPPVRCRCPTPPPWPG